MEQIIRLLVPTHDGGTYQVLWKHAQHDFKHSFSALKTWEQIRDRQSKKDWARIIWFLQGIMRIAFITWLAVRDRLSTSARSRCWDINQPCLLCGEPKETRDHLFFACTYSFMIWSEVVGDLLGTNADQDWTVRYAALTPIELTWTCLYYRGYLSRKLFTMFGKSVMREDIIVGVDIQQLLSVS